MADTVIPLQDETTVPEQANTTTPGENGTTSAAPQSNTAAAAPKEQDQAKGLSTAPENVTQQYQIPKECKAGVIYNIGPDFEVKVEMVPVPTPGPTDLLVKINCTGICFSDVHFMLGDLEGAPPMSYFGVRSPGHEGAGVVVAIGSAVKGWKIGDRAGIKPMLDVCGDCDSCFAGKENHCPNSVHTGLMATGTYQEYMLSPAKYTSRIPEGVPDHVAAPIMCSASTMWRSLKESGLRAGDWAAFPGGGGGVGIQGVQLARAMGIRSIVIDTGDAKRELALQHGAEAFVDFKEVDDVAAKVKEIADGIGAHGVFVTAPAAYRGATELVGDRIGAVIMCIGLPSQGAPHVAAPASWFIFKNRSIKGTLVGTLDDVARSLDFAKRGTLKQICEVYPIDRLPEAVAKLRRGEVAGRMVVDFNQ